MPRTTLPKSSELGTETTGPVLPADVTALTPVPVRFTACGEPAALSEIESRALSAISAEGLKLMANKQFAPGARVWHCPSTVKSAALVPVIDVLVTLSDCSPVFAIEIA